MSNGSLEGLNKKAIKRIERLKEEEMTKMLQLAGSMSLDSNSTIEPSDESGEIGPEASQNGKFGTAKTL